MPRVLVVEDDASLRHIAETALTTAGFDVEAAENGADALSLAAARPPDVVVLDSQMPAMDGVAFARAYRNAVARQAPIIAVSTRGDIAVFAALVGAAALLPKPYSAAELVTTARRVLQAAA